MEYEKIKNWLKDNDYQNSGLRTDANHRIDLYLSDVLYHYSKETVQQLESRIKELENNTTEVIMTKVHTGLGSASFQERAECCNMPSKLFNFCPNCGRKIVRN